MEHKKKIKETEKDIKRYFDNAKELASYCSFWNDVGILDALVTNDQVLGHISPLRDMAVFPKLPERIFRQMSRQALFAATALIAKYGNKEDFTIWCGKHESPIKLSGLPNYVIDLSQLRNPCDLWVNLMRGYLALAKHRSLIKDKICSDVLGIEGNSCIYNGLRIHRITANSIRRYEWLKEVSPYPYHLEAPSTGLVYPLCRYYGPTAKNERDKHELSKILSLGYSLYLLARIHRIQKPQQTMTFLSPTAILANLFDVTVGLPGPTNEELLLDTDTDQPLYYRAHQSILKLLGPMLIEPDYMVRQEIENLFMKIIFNPSLYQEPFVSLPYNSFILQVTPDGCVFFDDIAGMIPIFITDKLLEERKLRHLQGEAFRNRIETVVKDNGFVPFRVSALKRKGETIGDIDVGFFYDGCLCLIECKDVAPYPSLLLDTEEKVRHSIDHSKTGYLGWLAQSRRIQEFLAEPENLVKLSHDKNLDITQIKQILGLIVTNRPVFIYLTSDILVTQSIPKVMIVDELEVLLSKQWSNILQSAVLNLGK